MNVHKGTHTNRVEFWQPLVKTTKGKYLAVLSDDSVDRDNEIIGRSALQKMGSDPNNVIALMDHENKILNQVGEWVNRQVVDLDGHTSLVAEPKFFLSNPNAQIIKGMLDEGARMGISIGAIVKDSRDVSREGRTYKEYTDVEILEASFVAIPSNRHGMAMAIAKSYSSNNKEMTHMENDSTEELVKQLEQTNEELTRAHTESSELSKKFEETNKALADVQKELAEANEKIEELSKALQSAEEANTELEKKTVEAETTLSEIQEKKSVSKQFYEAQTQIKENEVAQEAFSKGKIPVLMR